MVVVRVSVGVVCVARYERGKPKTIGCEKLAIGRLWQIQKVKCAKS